MAQADVPVRGTSRIHVGWLGIGVLAVVVALVGGLVGYYIKASQSAPANPDQALANDLAAAWSTTYDTAKCSGSEVRARIPGLHAAAPTGAERSSLAISRRRSARVNVHSNGVASCS